jgi:hypothetical protein
MSLPNDDPVIACGESVLKRLREKSPGGDIPRLQEEVIIFSDDNYERQVVPRPFSFRLLSGKDYEALEQDSTMLQSLEKLWNDSCIALPTMCDHTGQPIRDLNAHSVRKNLVHFIVDRVCAFIDLKGTLDVDTHELGEVLDKDFKGSIAANVTRLVTVPLLNFVSNSKVVNLADGLTIEAFTPEEKTDLWGRGRVADGYIELNQLTRTHYKLSY